MQDLASGANYTWAGHNSATLTYFATEVYAYDIAVPGEGCVGRPAPASSEAAAHAPTTSSAPSAVATASASAAPALTSVAPTRVVADPATPTADAGKECHTHADGVIHCV